MLGREAHLTMHVKHAHSLNRVGEQQWWLTRARTAKERGLKVLLVLSLHRELTQKSSTMNGAVSLGQDWFGTAVEVNPKATLCNAAKGCSSTDTDTNGEQLEHYNTNAVYGMVDRSKKKIQSRKSGDLIPSTYGMNGM